MSEIKRNREQELAYLHKPLTSLTANAGSGKTHVLIDKYLNVLMNDINTRNDPSRIVAITFTKKAASELKKKLSEKLEKKINEESNARKKYEFQSFKRDLINSRISTIHSFCSAIIKDNPVDAGLSPAFSELEPYQSKDILENIIELEVSKRFNNEDKLISEILDHFNIYELKNHISNILDKSPEIFKNTDVYSKDNDEIEKAFYDYIRKDFTAPIPIINNALKIGLKKSEHNDSLIAIRDHLVKSFNSEINNDLNDVFIIDKIKIGRNKLSTLLSKEDLISIEEKELLDLFHDDFKKICDLISSSAKQSNFIIFNQLIQLSKAIQEEYQEYKKTNSLVDYDDMLRIASELLEIDSIRTKVQNSISYLMVDEFQDTSDIQYEIVQKLIPGLNQQNIGSGLFIVGDAKQSIYAFRNADVRVFLNAINDISNANKSNKIFEDWDVSEQEKQGDINLKVSYRMSPIPVIFINNMMNKIMNIETEYDVSYSDLICGLPKQKQDQFELIQENVFLNNTFGSIEFITEIIEKDYSHEIESDRIAKRIKYLIENESYEAGDFAVLFRNTTHLKKLKDALKNNSINYEIFGSKDFYKTHEINDIISFLKFLDNPFDDLNFIALLKSYFFNYNDDELVHISEYKGEKFFDKFLNYSTIEKNYKSIFTSHLLEYFLSKESNLQIRTIVNELLDKSMFYSTIERLSNRDQLIANAEKFLDICSSFEEKGMTTVHEFVQYLTKSAFQSDEDQSELQTEKSKVNLLTIHKSKGLEFKCVILFNFQINNNHPNTYRFSSEWGYSASIKQKDSEGKKTRKITPLTNFLNSKIDLQKEKAEEKRLLYVALTRAKEKIIISSTIKSTKKNGLTIDKGSYLENILYSLDLNLDDFNDSELNNKIINDELIYEFNGNRIGPEKHSFKIDINPPLFDSQINSNVNNETHHLLDLSENLIENLDLENFTASKINTFKNNISDYYHRYILGLPEFGDLELNGKINDPNAFEDEILGSLRGTVFHEVMEKIPLWHNGISVNNDELNRIIEYQFELNDHLAKQSDISNIYQMIMNTINNDFIKTRINQLIKSEHEVDLRMKFDKDYLYGSIDLLFFDGNQFEIWDWKTNKIDTENGIEKLKDKYEYQMKFYSYLVSKLYPEQKTIPARLLLIELAGINSNDWIIEFSFDQDDLLEIENELKENINSIKELNY